MNKIKNLYNSISKHSHYQLLPKSVEKIVGNVFQEIKRYEYERFDYIKDNINLKNSSILDIGSNTGFFTISSIENGAKNATAYEGNEQHSLFLNSIANEFKFDVDVISEYFYNTDNLDKNFDITFLLNVVHHLGDDFESNDIDMITAKSKMIDMINDISKVTRYLVFQMGYCWKGNKELLLFENGSKTEVIDFIKTNTADYWDIEQIGIFDKNLKYENINTTNIDKFIEFGEFGNRPLFILKSKKYLKGL
jgi:hypothetical protein